MADRVTTGSDSRNFRGKLGCLLNNVFDDEEELWMGVFVSVLAEGAFLTLIALRLLLGQVYLPQNLR
ncbi:MAG TPA: hypothetical protein DD453_00320 [Alteromonas macleodii]|jgi:hypothetical protein|nr:hypothetical protein [Alteromonas sp.]HBN97775.1 hypothetical protein [Alteromonas macleodii]HCG88915.1 hypothetical protein [Alteromonas macleodii]HCS80591.1 hypothetical protein [Alteromonas macleodii]|tara:strand:- start:834 stop:1034 length:201 start_codon:yes stop_codon:yes gene_type:complete